jgi:predicted DNA-binding transcriptional regulator YafY
MNRTDRLYALVEELRAVAPRPRSARRLAQHFEVSTRTIERDLAALQQAGVPIWATPGPGGGYVLDPVRTLPPLNFTPSEAAAMALALAASGPIPFGDAARAALRKVTAAMSTADRAGAHALLERIRLLQGEGLAATPALRVVERALVGQRAVRVNYQDKQGRMTQGRLVEPLGLVVGAQHTYLHGWCRLRNGPRAFRLDRIRHVTLTAEPVRNHQGVELDCELPPAAATPKSRSTTDQQESEATLHPGGLSRTHRLQWPTRAPAVGRVLAHCPRGMPRRGRVLLAGTLGGLAGSASRASIRWAVIPGCSTAHPATPARRSVGHPGRP